MIWTLVALLVIAAGVSAWVDPRRLRVGVLALLAAGLAVAEGVGPVAALALLVLALASLAVFAVVGGLTMRRQPGRRRAGLVALVLGVCAFAYCGALALAGARASNELIAWLLVLAVPGFHVAFLFVAFVGYGAAYGRAVRRWARPVDVVVVLGAGLLGDRVSPVLASRLDRGLQALEGSRARGRNTQVICSGGQGPDEPVPEAVAMARHLAARGLDPSLIWLEDRSTSTEENLRFSARVAGDHGVEDGRFAVVTNDFHAFRAAMLMRDAGLAGFALGAATAPTLWATAVLREFAAVLWEQRLLHAATAASLTTVAAALATG
ncbi:MAG: YdcF family protein [Aeromicrobium sp.]